MGHRERRGWQAELVITLFSENVPVKGVEILGALPGEFHYDIRFAAAASSAAKNARKVPGYLRIRRRLLSVVLVDLNAQHRREIRSEGTGLHGCPVSGEILGLYRHQFPLV